MLDVTDEASIRSARKTIEESLAGVPLDALVNNAGIAVGGPLECTLLDAVRRQFDVNVLGMLAVFPAFAPPLRAARGRIVNIGSMAGFFSPSFQGPYCASKHALEALSDSMRRELQPIGVRVVLLEPGSVDSLIVSKTTEECAGYSSGLRSKRVWCTAARSSKRCNRCKKTLRAARLRTWSSD